MDVCTGTGAGAATGVGVRTGAGEGDGAGAADGGGAGTGFDTDGAGIGAGLDAEGAGVGAGLGGALSAPGPRAVTGFNTCGRISTIILRGVVSGRTAFSSVRSKRAESSTAGAGRGSGRGRMSIFGCTSS